MFNRRGIRSETFFFGREFDGFHSLSLLVESEVSLNSFFKFSLHCWFLYCIIFFSCVNRNSGATRIGWFNFNFKISLLLAKKWNCSIEVYFCCLNYFLFVFCAVRPEWTFLHTGMMHQVSIQDRVNILQNSSDVSTDLKHPRDCLDLLLVRVVYCPIMLKTCHVKHAWCLVICVE